MALTDNNSFQSQFKPTVLVVDDEAHMTSLLDQYLSKAGFEVVCESDPRAALEKLHEYPVDIVLSDLIMPNMDGLELHEKIKAANYLCKFIAISGTITPKSSEHLLQRGISACFSKPVNLKKLCRTIKELLHLPAD